MNYGKKSLLTILMLCVFGQLFAQEYGNEWISFDQSYYKIKVAKDGVYRIPFQLLSEQGLPADAAAYKLYFRGEEVPMYQSDEQWSEDGYFDFYGLKNNGDLDSSLYKIPDWQPIPDFSLFSDTSIYFLTLVESEVGKRYEPLDHMPSEDSQVLRSFPYTATKLANNAHFAGTPVRIAGTNNNFADFEDGEGFVSGLITPGSPKLVNLQTPHVDLLGGEAIIQSKLVGRSNDFLYVPDHHMTIDINGLFCFEMTYESYSNHVVEIPLPVSQIKAQTSLSYESMEDISSEDVNSIAYSRVLYPRLFEFDGADFFSLELPAEECHFDIRNFGSGTDLRLLDISGANYLDAVQEFQKHEIALNALEDIEERETVLYNPAEVSVVTAITQRDFTDFSDPENQGDYLIVTVEDFMGTALQNFVDYRESAAGGNHQVVLMDVEELYDQFVYGVRKHPNSIKHLVNLGLDTWGLSPEYLFLVGKGIDYKASRFNSTYWNDLNLVPSYGSPPSDLSLTRRDNFSYQPQLAVGRLPVLEESQIDAYYQKVLEYEAWQNADCEASDTEWLKRSVHLVGGDNSNEETSFRGYLDRYVPILQDTLFGVNVEATFTQGSTSIVPQPEFHELMNDGISLITYMGHPGGEDWRFDIREPEEYDNEGKYPFINANSCFSGNIFHETDPLMAERYVLAPQRGSIGYLSVVNLGFPSYLDEFNMSFYQNACRTNYDGTVGEHIKNAIIEIYDGEGSSGHAIGIKRTCQSLVLAGDPAIALYTWEQADYQLDANTVSFKPSQVHVDQDSILVELQIYNKGRAIGDSVDVRVEREWGAGQIISYNKRAPAIRFASSFSFFIPNNDADYGGQNSLIVTVDPDNQIAESCEDNNSYIHTFELNASTCQGQSTGISNLSEQYCILDEAVEIEVQPEGMGSVSINGQTTNLLQPSALGPGLHELFYSAELDCGLSEQLYFIEVIDNVDFSIDGPSEICDGDLATYTVIGPTELAGVNYSWDFGEGASPATGEGIGPFEVSYAEPGIKQVGLVVIGDCIEEDLTWMSDVQSPQPDITISCLESTGSTITLGWEPSDVDAVFYGVEANGADPYHVYSANGQFTLQGLQPGTVLDIRMYVVGQSFNNGPCGLGNFSNMITCETFICEDIEIDFEGTEPFFFCMNDEPIALIADPPGGEFDGPGMEENIFDPEGAGIGYHTLDYYYQDSITQCIYRHSKTVQVSFYPSVWVDADTTICQDGWQLLSGTVGLDSYYWEPTGDTTQQIWVNEPGIYQLRAGTWAQCYDNAEIELVQSDFVITPIDLGPDTTLTEASQIVIGQEVLDGTYQWSTGEITPTITVDTSGLYGLAYTDINGCQSIDSISVIIDTGSVSSLDLSALDIQCYPNPVQDRLFIKTQLHTQEVRIQDVQGRQVYQGLIPRKGIDIRAWPSGLYVLEVQLENGLYVERVVKF